MRTLRFLCIILIVTIFNVASTLAQGFQPPPEGKSVIYFVNVKKTNSREYFHQDRYIGLLKRGKDYMRYVCNPGENLFWASAENKKFVTANLKEGGTYIVIGENKMGMWSAGIRLIPITDDNKLFEKARAIIMEKGPIVTPVSTIKLRNTELVEFIANVLDHYENQWKSTKDFPNISAEMAIPVDKLK